MNIYDISEKYEKLKKSAFRHSLIQIYDNGLIMIEECREVLLFDENSIKLLLPSGTIMINGLELSMRSYSERGVEITGKLHSIGFDDSGRKPKQ